MKRRFTINDSGQLVDREGLILGRITSITIDVDGGTIGGAFDFQSKETSTEEGLGESEGEGEAKPERLIWEAFVRMRQQSPKKLRRTAPDAQTTKMIVKALSVGTEQEWLTAVNALLRSPHHMGKNDRGKTYLEPRHVFTACSHGTVRQHLDWLLDLAPQGAGFGGVDDHTDPAVRAKITNAKRTVLTAFDLAGSGGAQEGDDARCLLERYGWRVEHDATGRPKFIAPEHPTD